MISVTCSFCGKELNETGGILLSPPSDDKVEKHHICRKCYKILSIIRETWIETDWKDLTENDKGKNIHKDFDNDTIV